MSANNQLGPNLLRFDSLRLGRVTELDTLGVGYLRDVKQPMREYLFAERQVVKLPEGPLEIAADSLVWYQLSSVGQVDFVVPASGLVGLAVAVVEDVAEGGIAGARQESPEFASISR
jgi:hypothetical protein